jgi:2-haloacid dehalogenase
MRYEWLLFDADGTIFDFAAAEAGALVRSLADHGIGSDAGTVVTYREESARVWAALEAGSIRAEELNALRFRRFFERVDIDGVDPGSFGDRYLGHLAEGTELMDGAIEVLAWARRRHRLALVTNGLAAVQRPRLAGAGLDDWFEHVVISEEIGVAKPAPGYFDVVFERLGDPAPGSVLIIGDSLSSDIAGGLGYGIDTCWFNPAGGSANGLAPTFEITDLRELIDLID